MPNHKREKEKKDIKIKERIQSITQTANAYTSLIIQASIPGQCSTSKQYVHRSPDRSLSLPFPVMQSIHLDGAANVVSLERVLLGLVLRSWDFRASDCVELAHHGVVDGAAGEALAVGVGLALDLAGVDGGDRWRGDGLVGGVARGLGASGAGGGLGSALLLLLLLLGRAGGLGVALLLFARILLGSGAGRSSLGNDGGVVVLGRLLLLLGGVRDLGV